LQSLSLDIVFGRMTAEKLITDAAERPLPCFVLGEQYDCSLENSVVVPNW